MSLTARLAADRNQHAIADGQQLELSDVLREYHGFRGEAASGQVAA
jgi:hypothetical protein